MAYDEVLADRIRDLLAGPIGAEFREIKMFGGLAFMVNTHMAVGIMRDDLMVRVGKENHEAALARGATVMEFGGRQMVGMVVVDADAIAGDEALASWVRDGASYALSQPPKPPKKQKAPRIIKQS